MCKFCDNRMNIINVEDAVEHKFAYCPMCGDALIACNEYFISLNGGGEIYWLTDLEEADDPDTMAYILSHASKDYLEHGSPVYRAVQIGTIQGYPKFVKH